MDLKNSKIIKEIMQEYEIAGILKTKKFTISILEKAKDISILRKNDDFVVVLSAIIAEFHDAITPENVLKTSEFLQKGGS